MNLLKINSHGLVRSTNYLEHPFNSYQSEIFCLFIRIQGFELEHRYDSTRFLYYEVKLTTEMEAVTWNEFCNIHPFAPSDQVKGYKFLIDELGKVVQYHRF